MTDTRDARSWVIDGISPAALTALTRALPATELWSLLLTVAEQRAAARVPANLLQQYARDRFVAPAIVDQRAQLELDLQLFTAAAAFEPIELSPVAPLGVCSAIAPTSQNRVISTMRGTEVVSDPTNVLALECARRLRADPADVVKLATSHRCVRAQPVPKQSGFTAHFRIFCLASAAHETKDQGFSVDSLLEHIGIHFAALDRLEQLGYRFPDRAINVLSTDERRPLADRIAARLRARGFGVTQEPLAQTYYDGLRFTIHTRAPFGGPLPLIDGGAFDWVAQLASNRKLVFVASAIGSQLAAHVFRRGPA